MTGAGIVLPQADATEVYRADSTPSPRSSTPKAKPEHYVLIRRIALNSLRDGTRRRPADRAHAFPNIFARSRPTSWAPGGLDEARVARLCPEAARRAMFDTSKEATLSRKYEAAAERGFYRALKELRTLRKPVKGLDPAAKAEVFREELGSIFSRGASDAELDAMIEEMEAKYPSPTVTNPDRGAPLPPSSRFQPARDAFDVPFAVGKAR